MHQNKWKRSLSALLVALLMTVSAYAAEHESLIPIGHTVGIELHTQGVLVVQLSEVQTTDGTAQPAKDAGVQAGDLIQQVNDTEVLSSDELQKQIALSAGQNVTLQIERSGQNLSLDVTPCADRDGVYRLGVVARDGMAGIGTLTFVDPETGEYGSLGHGICDSETGVLLPLSDGTLLYSVVSSVQRGKSGEPGALQGQFEIGSDIGTVVENTENGIYGTLTDTRLYDSLEAVPVAEPDEVQVGPAQILSNVQGDTVQTYDVEIVRLYAEDDAYGRSMMLRVTDPELLEQTGGIVQGMSGSPVIQNGKLIGAVTHVLVDDPTSGYAISISKMLDEMDS